MDLGLSSEISYKILERAELKAGYIAGSCSSGKLTAISTKSISYNERVGTPPSKRPFSAQMRAKSLLKSNNKFKISTISLYCSKEQHNCFQ